jgi:molybdopterin synthase catalytic subunit
MIDHIDIVKGRIAADQVRRDAAIAQDCGGLCLFEGLVRNINHGRPVDYLIYECYATLAIKEMRKIACEARDRFSMGSSWMIHREGRLDIGDTAVIIATTARHRNEAFLSCRYLIDQLKVRVPIWKKEFYCDGTHAWTRCHEHAH